MKKDTQDMPEEINVSGRRGTPQPQRWWSDVFVANSTKYIRADLAPPPAPSQDREIPEGAIENGRTLFERLRSHYEFADEQGHKLSNCATFIEVQMCFEYLAQVLQSPRPHDDVPTHRLDVHILLDTLAQAARGEPLDPETCETVESIVKQYSHKDFMAEDIQALYDCGARVAVPTGHVLVPVEPTEEMVQSGWDQYREDHQSRGICYVDKIYKQMLAAAPKSDGGA